MFRPWRIRHVLVTLLLGWVLLLSGLGTGEQTRFFKTAPDTGIAQELLQDEAGAIAGRVHWVQFANRLSEKPVIANWVSDACALESAHALPWAHSLVAAIGLRHWSRGPPGSVG
jgi:hypothetical protein